MNVTAVTPLLLPWALLTPSTAVAQEERADLYPAAQPHRTPCVCSACAWVLAAPPVWRPWGMGVAFWGHHWGIPEADISWPFSLLWVPAGKAAREVSGPA